MKVEDLFLAPLYLLFFYLVALGVRKKVTNVYTRPHFLPALALKFVGAIALGMVYQFYYSGGDTFNYYNHATHIHEAFQQSFGAGWKIMTQTGGTYDSETIKFTSQMIWYQKGSSELLLARVAAFFGLFCFNNYTVIGLFFAVVSFSGLWAMYITLVRVRPQLYKQLALAMFYIPSMFFWGSGLLKDSLCLGALGWLFFALYRGTILKRQVIPSLVLAFAVAYILFLVKIYILLSFLPAALLWIFNENNALIKNSVIRVVAKPFFFVAGGAISIYAGTNLTKGDAQYDIDKIGERSKITADYLYEVSKQQNGSAYSLGKLDGSIGSMVKLAPQAIGTALFRPFLWEAHNPVMLLSALEALFFLGFTLRLFWRTGFFRTFTIVSQTPILVLCFLFSLVFAASVGITSNNFGTLVRYKIPMIPFFLGGLYILQDLATAGVALRRKKPARTMAKA